LPPRLSPFAPADSQAAISPPPTHAELAARVSSHREAVTRKLKSLKRAGFLHSRPGAIILQDPAKIARSISEVE
jgi:DNA-binding IscR family transcriptional regulator